MGETRDIGRRIELVAMDPHFHDISIGLYRQQRDGESVFLVHTYSRREGAGARLQFVARAMAALGGMERADQERLRFLCGEEHRAACRRLFLEACKIDPDGELEPRPLQVVDRRSGLAMSVRPVAPGVYQVAAQGEAKDRERRLLVVAGGLAKLGEMEAVEGADHQVAFACGHPHDALVGLLLVRAPDVRGLLREQEAAAARGVLAAPSQQNR